MIFFDIFSSSRGIPSLSKGMSWCNYIPNGNSSVCEGSEKSLSGTLIVQPSISPERTGVFKERMKGKVREKNHKGLSLPSLEIWTFVHEQ